MSEQRRRPHEVDAIEALLGPGEPELSCEECFAQLDRYVELELGGADADLAVPGCGRTSRAAARATRTTAASAPLEREPS